MDDLFLFDIDLTLVRSDGAGRIAMSATMDELMGLPSAFEGMLFAGRTDRGLLREALLAHALDRAAFDAFCAEFERCYLVHLTREFPRRRPELLPGAAETIDAVRALPGARLGLATGNFRRAAEVKLAHFGLWERFAGGGFAEDGEHRPDLVAAAIRRVAGDRPYRRVFVIGDSIHDITAAVANGAVAVGVCTGTHDAGDLRAAGAQHVFESLADPQAVLAALLDT